MITKYLAQNGQGVSDIFGTVAPPPGSTAFAGDASVGLSKLITTGVQLFLFVGGLALLLYLMWGAFDWITSNGEKEKVEKARQKITNAIIGMVLMVVALGIFGLVTGDMLGIIVNNPNGGGWTFKLPSIGK
jgi:hypothetical protein